MCQILNVQHLMPQTRKELNDVTLPLGAAAQRRGHWLQAAGQVGCPEALSYIATLCCSFIIGGELDAFLYSLQQVESSRRNKHIDE